LDRKNQAEVQAEGKELKNEGKEVFNGKIFLSTWLLNLISFSLQPKQPAVLQDIYGENNGSK